MTPRPIIRSKRSIKALNIPQSMDPGGPERQALSRKMRLVGVVGIALTLVLLQRKPRPPVAIDPPIHPEAYELLAKMRTAYSSVRTANVSGTFIQYGTGKNV